MYISGDTRTDREIMEEIGARLKTLRKARGLTLAAVADLTDMNKSTVSRAEGGENPTLLTILRLLRAYGRVEALDGFIPSPELSPMDLLAESERVKLSFTWKVAQFALGRPLVSTDAPELEKIHAAAQAAGGSYTDLITAIVLSDLVLTNRNPQP